MDIEQAKKTIDVTLAREATSIFEKIAEPFIRCGAISLTERLQGLFDIQSSCYIATLEKFFSEGGSNDTLTEQGLRKAYGEILSCCIEKWANGIPFDDDGGTEPPPEEGEQ